MPRQPDPEVRVRLVEAAARVLATEGRPAVAARRLAREVGASTQVLYTHFDGMDDLLAEVWREGFRRFGRALDAPRRTSDPVADWMVQGWGYLAFARRDRHLYQVMFGEGMEGVRTGEPADMEAAGGTFQSLLGRIEACAAAGRWVVGDLFTAGEVVWGASHGQAAIELAGYFDGVGRDADATFSQVLRRLSLGFGDADEATQTSLRAARRRARRELAGYR